MEQVRRSGGEDRARPHRAAKIAAAYEDLAEVLELVDLDAEPELADAVIEAVDATHDAYEVETGEHRHPRPE